ncbi:hypothetical protein N7522_008281 [Penicillium canescens]|nr:hypothetical protein N7522_008281 [Penicillium canescens]
MGHFAIKENQGRPKRYYNRVVGTQLILIVFSIWLCYKTVLSWNASSNTPHHQETTPEPNQDNQFTLIEHLSRIIYLLPDEEETKALLTPIQTTGEQRLHDYALRTRQYKTLLEAWEDLHILNNPTTKEQDPTINTALPQTLLTRPSISQTLQTTPSSLLHTYESYHSTLTRLQSLLFPWTNPYYPSHLHHRHSLHHPPHSQQRRGLVFSAGTHQLPFLLTTIPALRNLGCTLPIEIMYLGNEDLSPEARASLEALPGVITRDIRLLVSDAGWELKGWAGKPFAVLLSSFREVIFIDADAVFLVDPSVLFEDGDYKRTGALFFRDRLIMPESKRAWLGSILPKPVSGLVRASTLWSGDSGHMQESGVLVIDTWRHFLALNFVCRMNGPDRDGDGWGVRGFMICFLVVGLLLIGLICIGDKETFWLGWELVGDTDYAFHNGSVGTMGSVQSNGPTRMRDSQESTPVHSGSVEVPLPRREQAVLNTRPKEYTICAPQLLHLDYSGRPLWFNGWLLQNKFAEAGSEQPGKFEAFVHEERGDGKDGSSWEIHPSNVCCLTAKKVSKFAEGELKVLKMVVGIGRRVGAFGGN